MKNLKKPFLLWLNALSSQQESSLTLQMRLIYTEMFWVCHPSNSLYISTWMKHDFYKMDIVDFMAKYLDEMENPQTSERRKKDIASVVLPFYRELTGRNYDVNLLTAYGIESSAS